MAFNREIEAAYREMAADETRESEAREWNGPCGGVTKEAKR